MVGFKKEVREFMAEVRGELNAAKILEEQIIQLRKHMEALMDRVMSQGVLREYKVNTMELPIAKKEPLDPEFDESLIGSSVDLSEG